MWSNEPIEIIMKIPFPINEPDRNGAIYTKEAIEKAVEKFDGGVPLTIVKDEVETVIGHIHSAELSENYEVTVHGEVFLAELLMKEMLKMISLQILDFFLLV